MSLRQSFLQYKYVSHSFSWSMSQARTMSVSMIDQTMTMIMFPTMSRTLSMTVPLIMNPDFIIGHSSGHVVSLIMFLIMSLAMFMIMSQSYSFRSPWSFFSLLPRHFPDAVSDRALGHVPNQVLDNVSSILPGHICDWVCDHSWWCPWPCSKSFPCQCLIDCVTEQVSDCLMPESLPICGRIRAD